RCRPGGARGGRDDRPRPVAVRPVHGGGDVGEPRPRALGRERWLAEGRPVAAGRAERDGRRAGQRQGARPARGARRRQRRRPRDARARAAGRRPRDRRRDDPQGDRARAQARELRHRLADAGRAAGRRPAQRDHRAAPRRPGPPQPGLRRRRVRTHPFYGARMAGTDARWRLGAGAAVLLVLGAVAGGVAQRMVVDAQPAAVLPTPVATATAELVVDVQGAVAEPGVYRLPQGSRVLDALARAGGTIDEAAPGALNLARPLADGEQLIVPTVEEQAAAQASPEEGGPVSLNRSDAAALETLPGVGPSLAGAIIAHREEHGPFTDIAQLDDVAGVGPATLDRL